MLKRVLAVTVCVLVGCSGSSPTTPTPTSTTVDFRVPAGPDRDAFRFVRRIGAGPVDATMQFEADPDLDLCMCVGDGFVCRPACGAAPRVSWGPETVGSENLVIQIYHAGTNERFPEVIGALTVNYPSE